MKIFKRLNNNSGQGMTEYIIIVALIAIAAIAAFAYFGGTVRDQTAAMTEELAGQDGSAETKKAGETAGKAVDESQKTKGLQDYADSGKELGQ